MQTILFIDGENFKKKLDTVFKYAKVKQRPKWNEYNFLGLFHQVLEGVTIDRMIFYAARLGIHPETREKSQILVEEQRALKTSIENQGFQFVYGGRVRANRVRNSEGKEIVVFKEKGVDVQIAVDMVMRAYRAEMRTAIIASSDSDLQPAIKALRQIGTQCIYLGFELDPNRGLTYTTNRTILIRNSEVLKFLPAKLIS